MKLTDDQIRAIQDLENNSVIMACPGSGKTTVLIHKMSLCCEKIKKYNSENLFKKEKGQETEKVVQEENNKLIVKRDLSFKKILAKLKSIFRFIKGL